MNDPACGECGHEASFHGEDSTGYQCCFASGNCKCEEPEVGVLRDALRRAVADLRLIADLVPDQENYADKVKVVARGALYRVGYRPEG